MRSKCESSDARVQIFYSREQRAKYPCLHGYLATAARVKDPAALQRCKFDTPLLAAGSLIGVRRNRRAGPPLPLLHGRTVLFVVAKGISVFYNTNHGLSGIQLNFISIVIIEFGRIIVS